MNELAMASSVRERNMDLWNNKVGRALALTHKTSETLAKAVRDAFDVGKLIIHLSDNRTY